MKKQQQVQKGNPIMSLAKIVQRGWDLVGKGDFETLARDYVEDMSFIMPGQSDVLKGREAFRNALNGIAEILPPGFEITDLRQIEGNGEVISIVEWKSDKVEESQLAVLFKFRGDKICEERWFIDTEQWRSAF